MSRVQFLKRTYNLGNGLYIMPGRYASDLIKNFEGFYGQAKKQKVPSGPEIQEADGSEELMSEEVALQISSGQWHLLITGKVGFELHDQRTCILYADANSINMSRMKKLVGYLKSTEGQRVKMPFPTRVRGMCVLSTQQIGADTKDTGNQHLHLYTR